MHLLEGFAGTGVSVGGRTGCLFCPCEGLSCPGQGEVAGEDRPTGPEVLWFAAEPAVAVQLLEAHMGTGLAAPGCGTVDDVVVDQSCGLEEFEGHAQVFDRAARLGASSCPEPADPGEHRTKLLPAAGELHQRDG